MEQMYLVEIFIDRVTIFASIDEELNAADKNLILKIKFGPKVQFIVREGQLAVNTRKDDIIETDGRVKKWTRSIRIGKSYLFPSYPDTVLETLSKFPLEIEVWNDDENEVEIFVGLGTMVWDTKFFHMLKESAEPCKMHEPLAIKSRTPLKAECCCRQCGEVDFIVRLSALGENIITEFQQLMQNPEEFVFRTNRAPSMFQCKRIEGDDPNFVMIGSLYETTTLEDPEVIEAAKKKLEVCTELQSCGVAPNTGEHSCSHDNDGKQMDTRMNKKYAIEKIRMGDIVGPCGNSNCLLAHKVKAYIRNLPSYKKEAEGKVQGEKTCVTRKICGACTCSDDKWHRETCPDKNKIALCNMCGGFTRAGETCEDKAKQLVGTGATPIQSTLNIRTVSHVPGFKEAIFGTEFTILNMNNRSNDQPKVIKTFTGCCCSKNYENPSTINCEINQPTTSNDLQTYSSCCSKLKASIKNASSTPNMTSQHNVISSYNVLVKDMNPNNYNFCTDIPDDKECRCNPRKPSAPCRTFDCDCLTEIGNKNARRSHKPFCPAYKHKASCPVNLKSEEEEKKEEEDEEAVPLPYGLPPVKLGPCPVLGKPCTYPDGFARMYRNAALPTLPPSYDDAGKVCCSKEYERIKKAIKEYMKYEEENDYRCINKFNVDTETRCCDKEQKLLSLMGKGCCGTHKEAIQNKFNEQK